MEALENIKVEASAAIDAAQDSNALEELRVSFLGKKGALTALLNTQLKVWKTITNSC